MSDTLFALGVAMVKSVSSADPLLRVIRLSSGGSDVRVRVHSVAEYRSTLSNFVSTVTVSLSAVYVPPTSLRRTLFVVDLVNPSESVPQLEVSADSHVVSDPGELRI